MAAAALSKVQRLRAAMKTAVPRGLAAYVTPSEDPHHSEYVAAHDERRAWLSGFDGSAGTAVVTPSKALLWTDGRYFLQAEKQLSEEWELMRAGTKGVPTVANWLAENLAADDEVGIDPTLLTIAEARRMKAAFKDRGIKLTPVSRNLVDELWEDQPDRPSRPLVVHPLRLCGRSVADKLADVRASLAAADASALVVTALDEVAWLFNVRGSDIAYNPVAFAFAIVTPDTATLYTDADKVTPDVAKHLGSDVAVEPYAAVADAVAALGTAEGAKVWFDGGSCNYHLLKQVPSDKALVKASPVTLAKAIKNEAEIEGFRQANIRDAAALVNFFAWLEASLAKGEETHTEYTIAERLREFRAEQPDFVTPSFSTIAGCGANGAIIHYSAEKDTAATVTGDSILLLDSGGQYLDGTTDTTRTVHFGTPTERQRRAYTRVLQGHIAVAKAVFPTGTEGALLDTLARLPLWSDGKNFGHGTGHGVGAYLNVHEGPQGISSRRRPYKGGFVEGMTTSNEPGYYEAGEFGIRIESVHVTKKAGEGRDGYLCFENFTPVPIQTKLVDASLLNSHELEWLNNYNAWCRETVTPLVAGDSLAYLIRETQPLAASTPSGGTAATVGGAGAGAGAGAGEA